MAGLAGFPAPAEGAEPIPDSLYWRGGRGGADIYVSPDGRRIEGLGTTFGCVGFRSFRSLPIRQGRSSYTGTRSNGADVMLLLRWIKPAAVRASLVPPHRECKRHQTLPVRLRRVPTDPRAACWPRGTRTLAVRPYGRVYELPLRPSRSTATVFGCLYRYGPRVELERELTTGAVGSSGSGWELLGRRVRWRSSTRFRAGGERRRIREADLVTGWPYRHYPWVDRPPRSRSASYHRPFGLGASSLFSVRGAR